jgi:methylmalonyl-CoA mutase cobalamin-binding subunit
MIIKHYYDMGVVEVFGPGTVITEAAKNLVEKLIAKKGE